MPSRPSKETSPKPRKTSKSLRRRDKRRNERRNKSKLISKQPNLNWRPFKPQWPNSRSQPNRPRKKPAKQQLVSKKSRNKNLMPLPALLNSRATSNEPRMTPLVFKVKSPVSNLRNLDSPLKHLMLKTNSKPLRKTSVKRLKLLKRPTKTSSNSTRRSNLSWTTKIARCDGYHFV